jgi:hypothetical protein
MPVNETIAFDARNLAEGYRVGCADVGVGYTSHTVGPTGAQRTLCGFEQLQSPVRVYSFGSNGDFAFEDALQSIRNDTDFFIFDPTLNALTEAKHAGKDRASVAIAYAKSMGYNFVEEGLAFQPGTLR